ncbi:MAG TPA: hypothetical protein VM911_18735, partial [Pyrinomonadaceae bacterium]|nr:hypothetical protein [Pyrinomonadaceae bacterium]
MATKKASSKKKSSAKKKSSKSPKKKAFQPEPEPQEGPRVREREFLEERLTPLLPKGTRRMTRALSAEQAENLRDEEEPPLPYEFRRQIIQQYRERQQTQEQPRMLERSEEGGGPPPEAPQAPPGNNWIPIGPSVLRQGQGGVKPATSGRTPAVAVAAGGTRIYIGAANGGVWRSDDTGQTWRSLMDAFDLNPTTPASDSLSIGAVAIDLANPDRVYVGTGEGDGAAYFGVGPVVTNNGTANPPAWTTEQAAPGSPSLAGTAFHSLAIDPANPDRVVAATWKGLYRREPNGGGGFHWAQKTLGGIGTQTVRSAVVAASGGVTTFYAARQNGPVYSSTDGNTWNQVGAGFPAAVGRVSLAVQRDNPNVIYALVQNGNVHRLDIADGNWRLISGKPAGFTTQGSYDLAIAVAPNNVNRIYIGGSTVLSNGDWSGSLYRCEIAVAGASVSMTPTYIGGSVHADIHAIVFTPGDANKLWVGCDGGVFYSTNPTGSGDIFVSRNTGLQTLTMEYLGQHPTEDAVLFAGTQDNGGQRFTGEEAWLYSSGGDAGYAVVNWNDPYKVLSTYVYGCIRRSTNGGQRYSYSDVNVPMVDGNCSPLEDCRFYAPLVGTPPNPGSATAVADSNLVAFGSIRPWISTTFGGGWQSIPNNNLAQDSLDGNIRSLVFASPTKLYAGTLAGGVYRFTKSGANWTRTQIDTIGGANNLQLNGPITSIAVDPTNTDRVYITFGGTGDYRHVWFFNGTQWQQRSGPSAGNVNSLLDVQANAIVVDPANTSHLYVGADLGVWRSTDSGANWSPFSQGLPDAGVIDLVLHNPRRLLRAATHGRGVFERTLPDSPKQGVELYVRSTQLDMGRGPAVNGLPDPTAPGQTVVYWRGPDIKLDTPDAMGNYQFPLTGTIDFLQFVDTLTDDFQNVATHATTDIITRVYVQIHNRGVLTANNVRVMLLLTNASAGLPALPAGFDVNVRNGIPINTANWQTIGFDTLNDLRAGFPKIASFSLHSSMLPPPANLAGNQHQCVLALVHHADDQFTNTQTNVNSLSSGDRKAAHKNMTVVQFTGTLPTAMPVVMPLRINNANIKETLLTNFVVNLNGYPGRVQLLIPQVNTEGDLKKSLDGVVASKDSKDLRRWAKDHAEKVSRTQKAKTKYHRGWAQDR